jgi:hypothetical protein
MINVGHSRFLYPTTYTQSHIYYGKIGRFSDKIGQSDDYDKIGNNLTTMTNIDHSRQIMTNIDHSRQIMTNIDHSRQIMANIVQPNRPLKTLETFAGTSFPSNQKWINTGFSSVGDDKSRPHESLLKNAGNVCWYIFPVPIK